MVTLFVAALVLGSDPYHGFRVRYVAFGRTMYAPFDVETLKRRGCDLTSVLYDQRKDLVEILRRAKEPSAFKDWNVRMFLQQGKESWQVDLDGVVKTARVTARLSAEDFKQLRGTILQALPGIDMEWREVFGVGPS